MGEQKRGMTRAQKVWLWLLLASFFVSICFFGISRLGSPGADHPPTGQTLPTPIPATTIEEALEHAEKAEARAEAAEKELSEKSQQQSFTRDMILSFLPSFISLIGFISTTALDWRKEAREAQAANLELEKMRLELERARLEIEKQRIGQEEGEKEDDDEEPPDWLKDIRGNGH